MAAAWVLLYSSWLLFHWGFHANRAATGSVWFVLIGIIDVIVAASVAGAPTVPQGVRRAWGFVGAGLGTYVAGSALQLVRALDHSGGPTWSSTVSLALYPLVLVGMAQLPRPALRPEERARIRTDMVIVLLSAVAIVWDVLLGPIMLVGRERTLQTALSVATPVGDILLLVGLATVAQRGATGISRRSLAVLAPAVVAAIAADLISGHLALLNAHNGSEVADALRMSALVLAGGGAAAQLHAEPGSQTAHSSDDVGRYTDLLPYVAIVVTLGLLTHAVWHDRLALGLCALVGVIAVGTLARLHRVSHAHSRQWRYFRALIENLSDTVVTVDRSGRLTFIGPEPSRLFGQGKRDGPPPQTLSEIPLTPESRAVLAGAMHSIPSHPGRALAIDLVLQPLGQESHTFTASVTNLLDDPVVAGTVIVFHDVTERTRLLHQLRDGALHDSLTGLPNRVLVEDRLASMLDESRHGGSLVCVIIVGLDEFRSLNERLGRSAGDEILRRVGGRLATVIHGQGTVGRLASDEFIVVVNSDPVPEVIQMLAGRLLDIVRQPMELESMPGHLFVIEASAGAAVASAATAEALMQGAAVAMHQAKANGRGRFVVCDETMRRSAETRARRREDLRAALDRSEFQLAYQPIVDLAGGNLLGAEALLRWRHPTDGLLLPGAFIAELEASRLIEDVGQWVLSQACAQARQWYQAAAGLTVHVNVSVRQLHSRDVVAHVRDAIDASGISPSDLTIEVTESTLITNVEGALERIVELKSLGVDIAVDDFGTGYSSFAYLRRLPVDVLKIDGSFITDVLTSKEAATLVEMLIGLGHELDMKIIAEGVEHEGQRTWLRAAGCDAAQGFLFSPPVPPDQIEFLHLHGVPRRVA